MDPEEAEDDAAAKKGGMVTTIIAFVVISVVAVGAGWFLGTGFAERGLEQEEEKVSVVVKKKKKGAKKDAHGGAGEEDEDDEDGMRVQQEIAMLDPIVTNLGSKNDIWLRLELAVVFGKGKEYMGDVDNVNLTSDIVSYLRTIDAKMVSGPSGYIHLHEDLVDRVRLTTEGRAVDVKVLTLVVE